MCGQQNAGPIIISTTCSVSSKLRGISQLSDSLCLSSWQTICDTNTSTHCSSTVGFRTITWNEDYTANLMFIRDIGILCSIRQATLHASRKSGIQKPKKDSRIRSFAMPDNQEKRTDFWDIDEIERTQLSELAEWKYLSKRLSSQAQLLVLRVHSG